MLKIVFSPKRCAHFHRFGVLFLWLFSMFVLIGFGTFFIEFSSMEALKIYENLKCIFERLFQGFWRVWASKLGSKKRPGGWVKRSRSTKMREVELKMVFLIQFVRTLPCTRWFLKRVWCFYNAFWYFIAACWSAFTREICAERMSRSLRVECSCFSMFNLLVCLFACYFLFSCLILFLICWMFAYCNDDK